MNDYYDLDVEEREGSPEERKEYKTWEQKLDEDVKKLEEMKSE